MPFEGLRSSGFVRFVGSVVALAVHALGMVELDLPGSLGGHRLDRNRPRGDSVQQIFFSGAPIEEAVINYATIVKISVRAGVRSARAASSRPAGRHF
jgi:hypothetical protein